MTVKCRGAYFSVEIGYYFIVIAIITTVVIGAFFSMIDESKENKAMNDIMNIATAVSHYHYDTGNYPANLDALTHAGTGDYAGRGPWIGSIRNDPWGNSYRIISNERDGFVVYSTHKGTQSSAATVSDGVLGFHGR